MWDDRAIADITFERIKRVLSQTSNRNWKEITSSRNWVLHICRLITFNSKTSADIVEILQSPKRESVSWRYLGTMVWFRKLIELFHRDNQIIENRDLWREHIRGEKIWAFAPSLHRATQAWSIITSLCREYKESGKEISRKELLCAFEWALLPYYVPFEDKYMDGIQSLVQLLHAMLISKETIQPAQRPNQALIEQILNPDEIIKLDKYYLDFIRASR